MVILEEYDGNEINVDKVEELLELGENPNIRFNSGSEAYTNVHDYLNTESIANYSGANIDGNANSSYLTYAFAIHNVELIESLLKHGATMDESDQLLALASAIRFKDKKLVDVLVSLGIDLDMKVPEEKSIGQPEYQSILAVMSSTPYLTKKYREMAYYLIEKGANSSNFDDEKDTDVMFGEVKVKIYFANNYWLGSSESDFTWFDYENPMANKFFEFTYDEDLYSQDFYNIDSYIFVIKVPKIGHDVYFMSNDNSETKILINHFDEKVNDKRMIKKINKAIRGKSRDENLNRLVSTAFFDYNIALYVRISHDYNILVEELDYEY